MSDESKTLDMHCEARGSKLITAYDAMVVLSAQERRLVLEAADLGGIGPLVNYLVDYRTGLGEALRWAEQRGKQAEDSIT